VGWIYKTLEKLYILYYDIRVDKLKAQLQVREILDEF